MTDSESGSTPSPNGSDDADRAGQVVEQILERMQRGEDVDLDEVIRQHPDLQPDLKLRLETLQLLFAASDESVDTGGNLTLGSPQPPGFQAEIQLHFNCPHCGVGIDVVDQQEHEVTCRNCGSSIQLTPGHPPSATASLILQRRQLGRFLLREQVGRGGFGVVFRAYDTELKRDVAIKLPRDGYFTSPDEEQRFLREARHAARLHHPHIVPVHEIGRDEGSPYIVSEFIDGMTLGDMINHRRLEFMESAELLAKVADAVQYAHSHKIVHRDIKPGNILLNHELEPFVADFGLATADDGEFTITLKGQLIGTPAYMSPEQVQRDSALVGPQSDVYALGVVFYRMLTGELPFRGGKRLLMHQIRHEEPRAPRSINEFIPLDLETIALKAMEKDRSRRYASASDLADDLRRAVRGDPIVARPISSAEKLLRLCRRYPVVATLSIAVALLLLVTAIGALVWGSRESGLRMIADQNAVIARTNLVRNYIERGNTHVTRGDYLSSLPDHVRAWELESGLENRDAVYRLRLGTLLDQCPRLVSVQASESPVTHSAFSPDNRFAMCAFQDGNLRVWEVRTGRMLVSSSDNASVSSVAFAPNSRHLVSGRSDGSIQIWNLDSRILVATRRDHLDWIMSLSFNATGDRLVSGSNDGFARVRSFPDGGIVADFPHEQPVKQALFLNDDQLIVSSWEGNNSADESQIFRWSIDQPESPASTITHPSKAHSLIVNESSEFLLTISRDNQTHVSQLRIHDLRGDSAAEPVIIELDSAPVHAEFLLDRQEILVVTEDGRIRTYEVESGELRDLFDTGVKVACAALDPSQELVALGSVGNQMTIWDYRSRTTICAPLVHVNRIENVAFSNNSRYVMTFGQDGFAKIWDIEIAGHPSTAAVGDGFFEYRINHSGKLAALLNQNGSVSFVSLPEGNLTSTRLLHPDTSILTGCDFSPDDRQLVTSDQNGIARVWDVSSGSLVSDDFRARPDHGFNEIRFSPNGNQLIASQCRFAENDSLDPTVPSSVVVWDRVSKQRIAELPHGSLVWRVEPSPDGKYLATIGMDRAVHLWNLETGTRVGEPLHQLTNPQYVRDCRFSADGTRLMTAGGDLNCFVWDVDSGNVITGPLKHRASVSHAIFHPQDLTPVTATDDGHVRVWGRGSDPQLRRMVRTFGTSVAKIGFDATGLFFFSGTTKPALDSEDKRFTRGTAQIWDSSTGEMVGPLFPSEHGIGARNVLFGKTANFISIADEQGNVFTWQLRREQRSLEQVRDLCEVLSAHRIDEHSSVVPLTASEFMKRWTRLREKNTVEISSSSYSN